MPWYYYSGAKPTPIPVGDGGGEVRSVRPHTKVEIFPSSENDKQIRNLSKMGVLRRCGKPKDAQDHVPVQGGVVPLAKSESGEPFRFSEFLTKEGATQIGRPSAAESVAPADRASPKKTDQPVPEKEPEVTAEAQEVADDKDGDVQVVGDTEEGSPPKRRSKRRGKSNS